MAEHRNRRFCWTAPECENGDTFVACNLNQLEPHTAICEGKTIPGGAALTAGAVSVILAP